MLKRVVKICAGCFAVSLLLLAISIPLAVKDGIRIYNSIVGNTEPSIEETVIDQPVTELTMVLTGTRNFIGNVVMVSQSADEKIHIKTVDRGFLKYKIDTVVSDGKAVVSFTGERNGLLSEENVHKAIASEMMDGYLIELSVPKTVSITSQETDGFYFEVPSIVEFSNAELIRKYGFIPTEEGILRVKYEKAEEELQILRAQYEDLKDTYDRLTDQYREQNEYWDGMEQDETESGYETNLQRQIQEYRRKYDAEEMTLKQYNEMTEDLYRQLRDTKENQVTLAIEEGRLNEATGAQVMELVNSLSDKLKVLDGCQIEEITNRQMVSHNMMNQEDYTKASQSLFDKKVDVQFSIEKDKRALNELGYDWERGSITPVIPEAAVASEVTNEEISEEKPVVN